MAARKKNANLEPATLREVRTWAVEKGLEVGQRGKIKAEIVEAYTTATGRPLAA